MDPVEKLRADVDYWQRELSRARETVVIGEAILPGLKGQLSRFDNSEPETEPSETERRSEPIPSSPSSSARFQTLEVDAPRFNGEGADQVEQALEWRPEQSADDLQENIAKYGRSYSRGAIGYALRKLRDQGKVRQVRKVGNVTYFSLTKIGDSTEEME